MELKMKVCRTCGEDKPYSEYHKDLQNKVGYKYQCKLCTSAYKKDYMGRPGKREQHRQNSADARQRNKEFLIDVLNASEGCMDCGNTDVRVLEWDHRDPAQKVHNVSYLVSKGHPIVQVQAEMDKCDLVCANCHRIRTAEQFGYFKNGGGLPA